MALSYRNATHLGGLSSRAVQLQRPFTVARPQGLRRPCSVVVRAAAEPQADVKPEAAPAPAPAPAPRPPQNYVVDDSFSLKKVSFGGVLTPIGVSLLVYGFCAYFQFLPGVDLSAVMLIYGFPLTLLGFALSYTALAPVSLKSTQEALSLRDSQATDNQKQVREDCTRFRYGDEQHLDEALQKIFRYGRSGGIPRKDAPTLVGLREEVIDGAYTLVMEFSSKLDLATWQERQAKFQSFFGPGVIAQMEKSSQGVDVLLLSDRSGRGRGGAEKLDPLMPLMPGLPPRKQ